MGLYPLLAGYGIGEIKSIT